MLPATRDHPHALLVLCCGLALGAAGTAARAVDPAGSWTGSIEATEETGATDLAVELRHTADGFWTGTLDAGDGPVRLTAVTVAGGVVRFIAEALPGAPEFSGRLSADGLEIAGDASFAPPAPPPGADVWLAAIEHPAGSPGWRPGPPVDVTDRDGYDNQPRFVDGGSALLYTSIRDGQADVYRVDLDDRSSARLTETVESEYSPTPLPSGAGFSTVRVEGDGTQRLWSFDRAGGEPRLLLEEVRPVGYHGWLDEHRLGLFVLGSPPTLQLADVGLQTVEVLAEAIGRSIHVTPDGRSVSFVSKADPSAWTIDLIDLETRERRTLISTREGAEDFTWTPDGRILMAEGSALYAADPGAGPPIWEPIADLAEHGVSGITRLDVSPDFAWLALAAERPSSGPPPERPRRAFHLRRAG